MNSSDCAKRILLTLSGDGAEWTQVSLSQALDVPLERLAPVIAGLAHNRYVNRDFEHPGVRVSLTDEGRRWASGQPLPGPREYPQVANEKMMFSDLDAGSDDKSGVLTLDRQRKRAPAARSASSAQGMERTTQVAKIVRRSRRTVPAA